MVLSIGKKTYKYSIKVAYKGKNYAGSQIQPDRNTIQAEIEKAISTLIMGAKSADKSPNIKRKIKTIFSSRTDRGVSAKGQIVHFEVDKQIVASRFITSLNCLLPDDISVSELSEVEDEFNARKSAKRKHYQYVFFNRVHKHAFDDGLLLVKYELNHERMQKALSFLIGEHDFAAFKSSGSANPHTDCFIYKAECNKLGDKIVIDIVGNRFLYNMVRTIVGTLLLIERNNLSPDFMKEVLAGKDRTKAGKTVNPYGLTLMQVDY